MAYGTPADPVGGTVITVAYAVANLLDPIRWLRLLTGNADPPGSNYVVVSTSTTGTSWQKVPGDAIAAGAIGSTQLAAGAALANLVDESVGAVKLGSSSVTNPKIATDAVDDRTMATGAAVANLGYTPANLAGAAFTGSVSIAAAQTLRLIGNLLRFTAADSRFIQYDSGNDRYVFGGDVDILAGSRTMIHSGSIGSQSVATAANALLLNSVTWKAPLLANASSALTLTTSYQTIPGCSLSLDRVGKWLLIGTAGFNWAPAGADANNSADAQLVVDGSSLRVSPTIRFAASGPDLDAVTFMATATLASQPVTATLQAKKFGGSASSTATDRSQLLAIWLSPS